MTSAMRPSGFMAERMIHVEVVCAEASQAICRHVEVAEGSTAIQAIEASGILDSLPDGAFDPALLGIFSCKVTADHLLREGDRVEIYRRLLLDPMEARRRRAR
ncbi:RnfH family protein [Rhodanobacter sp. AS-Z3]|uniref:RnfH family protein n=1 Tax=Rhodanobacter sp. AS-Z3 TaxID=3031330 RepID=UPI002478820B|nr:RnfH family protein [Rhodanobacter sp. AS-Z3]WEN13859.1 RnfH family protein [Rhodanobacter sp. AS-Z3]